MVLNPFLPEGIDADTAHFLDTFLLHCLLSPSAPDTLQEIAELSRNQHLTASRGREPGLMLERRGAKVSLIAWAQEVLQGCRPVAEKLDAAQGHGSQGPHLRAWQLAWDALVDTSRLPSARVLAAMQQEHGNSHVRFALAQSLHTRETTLALPLSAEQLGTMSAEAAESLAKQARVEAADTMPFEVYRQAYLEVRRLGLPSRRDCA